MAAKSHLRNGRPVVIALSTNDALSGSAENLSLIHILRAHDGYHRPRRPVRAV